MQSSARSSQSLKTSVVELAELAQFAESLADDAQASFRQALERASQRCEEAERRCENDAQTLRFIRSALESLRAEVKYVLFDLEATRRENDRLRQLLDSRLNNER